MFPTSLIHLITYQIIETYSVNYDHAFTNEIVNYRLLIDKGYYKNFSVFLATNSSRTCSIFWRLFPLYNVPLRVSFGCLQN